MPTPGPLTVRVDGEAEATLALDFGALAGTDLVAGDTGREVAALVEARWRAAVDGGNVTIGGAAVVDAERRAELRATTVRWDRHRRRLVIASGRHGVVTVPDAASRTPSAAAVEDGRVAAALGLTGDAFRAPGRVVRHKRPAPTAVAIDIRFDLWAGTQLELAAALDGWARITPTRGQLLERPALLAADVEPGATEVVLQPDGEPPTRWTLLQLERGNGIVADRLTGRSPALAGGATADDQGVRLDGAATATMAFLEPPPIPYAWLPERPGHDGYAVSVGVRLAAGAGDGDSLHVASLEQGGRTILGLDVDVVQQNGDLVARVIASGETEAGTPYGPVVGIVPAADFGRGLDLHVVIDRRQGASLHADGTLLAEAEGEIGPLPGGADMRLTLGDAGGTPVAFTIVHAQVHGRPFGPVDPKLRSGTAPAAAWLPGDPICLAPSDDGVTVAGDAFTAEVVAVDGDTLTLDRAVAGRFRRGSTLVYARPVFFSQRQLRRQDDLMNQLYRVCVEYRVSTYLDEPYLTVSAPLVEIPMVEVRDKVRFQAEQDNPLDPHYPLRPATGHPGTRAELVPAITVTRTSQEDTNA